MEELFIEAAEALGAIFSVPEIVKRYEITFLSEEDLKDFESLFRSLEDSVRKRGNRGFTNRELRERGEEGSYVEINWGPDKMEFREKAIDPDAPCPCGSGKKYRQCCGRGKW